VRLLPIIMLLVVSLFWLQTASAKDLKVGVVDIARVLEESPQAETARQNLQKEFAPREKNLIDTQKKIRDKEEQLARDGAIMSKSERDRVERDIISLKREFQRDQDEFRDDLNFKRNEILEGLQRKLIGSIQNYAKTNNFDLLLAEGVVYTSDALNVTEAVLNAIKKDAK